MNNRIPQSYLDDLLASVDIAEVIRPYVSFEKKHSSNLFARCPFHEEKTPSFSVNVSKQMYHCFGCGVGGNAISFLMAYRQVSFFDAVTELAETAHKPLPDTMHTQQSQSGPT